jgi:hypothetical protein
MVTSPMLARQTSLRNHLPSTLTPLLRYSCKLFVAPENLNSFAINQIQTLCAKHPGYGVPLHTSHEPRVTDHVFARPLFSHSYELLFPPVRRTLGGQLLCFDNVPHCPGVSGRTSCPSLSLSNRVSAPPANSNSRRQIHSFHPLAASLASFSTPAFYFQQPAASFAKSPGWG